MLELGKTGKTDDRRDPNGDGKSLRSVNQFGEQ
jgi:hypothetical protein